MWSYAREVLFYSTTWSQNSIRSHVNALKIRPLFHTAACGLLDTHLIAFLIFCRERHSGFPFLFMQVLALRGGPRCIVTGAWDVRKQQEWLYSSPEVARRQFTLSLSWSSPEATLMGHDWDEFLAAPMPVKNCWHRAVLCSHCCVQRTHRYDSAAELAVITFFSWAKTH